jgi:hypothetical protein
MSTDPDSKDLQIRSNPYVKRHGEGEFEIRDLLLRPWLPDWRHDLVTGCDYCDKVIKITLYAPLNCPEFAFAEARRVARREHLRSEHTTTKSKDKK